MPFTVSHIAAVVPFARPLRRAGWFSAAAIGSMAPDFGLLLPVAATRSETHGLWGLLTFVLPWSLLAWGLFQFLVKPAVWEVLPDRWTARLLEEQARYGLDNPAHWLAVVGAILAGALSHLLWDSVTHPRGFFTDTLPGLRAELPAFLGLPWHVYDLTQHLSTVLGLGLVLWALGRWVKDTAARPAPLLLRPLGVPSRLRWAVAYLAPPVLIVGARALALLTHGWGNLFCTDGLSTLAILAMTVSGVSLLAVSALLTVRLTLRGARATLLEI